MFERRAPQATLKGDFDLRQGGSGRLPRRAQSGGRALRLWPSLDSRRQAGAGRAFGAGRLAWRPGGGETPESIARIAALDQATLDAEAEVYLREMRALAPDKTRIVDKMPGNYLYVWLIALLFPKAKIIHCLRDPRDIGFSIFTFRFHGEHGYAHDLADLGWAIGEQDRLMNHWKAALPAPILSLRLDAWVKDFDATLGRVLDFVDLRRNKTGKD